uniref:Uncharacterized protein n=1 Tax=Molossus molossus TaxID=27622 RepID=A0A7J8EEI4_MOLMO|nr:hypothetical protein HJG59_008952 [Molossus molossus]
MGPDRLLVAFSASSRVRKAFPCPTDRNVIRHHAEGTCVRSCLPASSRISDRGFKEGVDAWPSSLRHRDLKLSSRVTFILASQTGGNEPPLCVHCKQFWKLLLRYLKLGDTLLSHVQWAAEPTKGIFTCVRCFELWRFFLFWTFPSPCLRCQSVLV